MIPRVAHFVFGLDEQRDPFHFVHYMAIESCRRVLKPEVIYFHHKYRPWGPWWDRSRPNLELVEVDLVEEVLAADYSIGRVPGHYRYAHHADFIRLDALIEHGGVYADIDSVFVREFRGDLFERSFVIGAEPATPDERTGLLRESLCNALMMSEPGARFARVWRERMANELNGTWSNHSGFLASNLSREIPDSVHVEPQATFFPFPPDMRGLAQILEEHHPVPEDTLSIHLWAHLWWERARRDISRAHAGWCTPSALRQAHTTIAELARPYLVEETTPDRAAASVPQAGKKPWAYMSLDESSGYGVAASRCVAALEDLGVALDWLPFVRGRSWGFAYEPAPSARPVNSVGPGEVAVAHLLPEFYPAIRDRCPESFLVGHTAWDTDRIPEHWVECLDSCDLLVVPSSFSAASIGRSRVRTPVAVVPHVAPSVRRPLPGVWNQIPKEVFVFYTIAEWNERKAVWKTIEAYLSAFNAKDPVMLVVKTSHFDYRHPVVRGRSVGPGTTAWATANLLGNQKDPPQMIVVTRELTDHEITALHERGDCLVSVSRGEGWDLGAFDAAAFGNPVVTTGFGGQLDYLGDSHYFVNFDLVQVDNPAGYPSYSPDQRWAEPDSGHCAELLRQVLEDQEAARSRAKAMATEIATRYAPARVAEMFVSSVRAHMTSSRGRRERGSAGRGSTL